MKTVQMTLDESLISEVDKIVKKLGTSRSAFTRDALQQAINQIHIKELEQKQREGYLRQPVTAEEFSDFEEEQVWGEE